MTSPTPQGRPAERTWPDRPPFLQSHRALAVCSRELARLLTEVGRRVTLLHSSDATEAPVVRQSPDRYIVQLGGVALTVAWLRGTPDTVADGELLVIVWRGMVHPKRQQTPERAQPAPVTSATMLWEDVLSVVAESESAWRWRSNNDRPDGLDAEELADRCVDRLRLAYAENRAAS